MDAKEAIKILRETQDNDYDQVTGGEYTEAVDFIELELKELKTITDAIKEEELKQLKEIKSKYSEDMPPTISIHAIEEHYSNLSFEARKRIDEQFIPLGVTGSTCNYVFSTGFNEDLMVFCKAILEELNLDRHS